MTGVVYRVRNCDTSRPPITATPSGRRNSEPVPLPTASGSAPKMAFGLDDLHGWERYLHLDKKLGKLFFRSKVAKNIERYPKEPESQSLSISNAYLAITRNPAL